MKTYQITLPDDVAAFVDRVLAEKKWDDVDHLVMDALGYVESELEADAEVNIDDLRKAVQVGIDQADRGELAPLDTTAIWARVQQRLAEKQEAVHADAEVNIDELRKAVQIGIDQADRGELVDGEITMKRLRDKLEAAIVVAAPNPVP